MESASFRVRVWEETCSTLKKMGGGVGGGGKGGGDWFSPGSATKTTAASQLHTHSSVHHLRCLPLLQKIGGYMYCM